MRAGTHHLLLRCYRVGVLIVLVVLVYQQARWFEAQRGAAISIRQARKFFPNANRVQLRDAERGLHYVTDARGETIGCLLTTSPQTDNIIGYSGPNNLLLALDRSGAVVGIELLRSGDTAEYVQAVKRDSAFFRKFIGWRPSDGAAPKVEGLSGATLTSLAMAEAVQQRLGGAAPSLRFPEPVSLDEARTLFTNASRLVLELSRLRVFDASGNLLGFVVRTSPQADNVAGYRGPTECLVALAPDGRTVVAARVRRSYDTDSYVDQLRQTGSFMASFVGKRLEQLMVLEAPSKEKIEGISGATMTARAISEGIKRRADAEVKAQAPSPRWRPKPRDLALAAVVAGALIMAFSPLRGYRAARIAWQLLLVGYVGLVSHDMLSVALFGGWAANGIALKTAPGLVLLAIAGLLVPWSTRRQVYCHQICPHGAAQQLIGGLRNWTRSRRTEKPVTQSAFRSRTVHALEYLPGVLLGLAVFTLVLGWPVNLVNLEPFDAWSWRTAGVATIVIAVVGLVASYFVPQAYCRFGCPTGALLKFVRSTGSADRWAGRDSLALALVVGAVMAVIGVRAWPVRETEPEPLKLAGRTMGTTWSVKIRDEVADPQVIEKAIADEFEWAESLISNWRTNTDLSVFNRAATTNPMPVPWPVLTLSRLAAGVSRETGGAYDITVGPLVKLWGFGPGPRRIEPPSDTEIAAVLPEVGWQKLEVLDGMLRKQEPRLEVDLSSLGMGWAVDQVSQSLDRRGFTNYLVEAGGQLRARGVWTIAIEHPTRTCTLTNKSISTSGTYRQKRESGGKEYSHLIDARTGRPVTHRTVSVSVLHTNSMQADVWDTALNVLGAEEGLPLAGRLGIAAQFVIERNEGKFEILETSAWKEAQRRGISSDR